MKRTAATGFHAASVPLCAASDGSFQQVCALKRTRAHAQLRIDQPVSLWFHQQRPHSVRFDLCDYIPSKFLNPQCQPRLVAISAIGSQCLTQALKQSQGHLCVEGHWIGATAAGIPRCNKQPRSWRGWCVDMGAMISGKNLRWCSH